MPGKHDELQKLTQPRQPLVDRVETLRKRDIELAGRTTTTTLVMKERSQLRKTYVHIRGDFLRKGREVQPGVPASLPALPGNDENPNRLSLAQWLVASDNPLTPRVTVNRIWQHYFGKGIVETENDFGAQGSAPTHPQLLDHLAANFVDSHWSLKQLHRQMVTSAVYRQSSNSRRDLNEIDSSN